MSETIHLIATGGTIDSVFNPPTERKIMRHESGLEDFLNKAIRPKDTITYETPFMIDGHDMTDSYRERILNSINNTSCKKILLSHGTDNMTVTAEYLSEHLKQTDKTIIMFGAMLPLDGFYHSDAPFNMGYALAEVKSHPAGIYICMNGHTFNPGEVKKNTAIGEFEHKEAS